MIGKGSLVQIAIQVSPTRRIIGGLGRSLGFETTTGYINNANTRGRTYAEIATVTLTKSYQNETQLRNEITRVLAQQGWTLAYYPEIQIKRLVAGSQAY